MDNKHYGSESKQGVKDKVFYLLYPIAPRTRPTFSTRYVFWIFHICKQTSECKDDLDTGQF